MGKNFIVLIRFWGRVIKRYFDTAKDILGIGNHLLQGIMIGIAIIVVAFLGSNGIIEWALLQGYVEDAKEWSRVGIILILLALALFIFNFFWQPAKMYAELGGFIKSPFEFEALPPRNIKDKTQPRFAGFLVKNMDDKTIEDCYVKLEDVINRVTGKSELEFTSHRRLCWGAGMGNTGDQIRHTLPIPGKDHLVCDIGFGSYSQSVFKFTAWVNIQEELMIGEYDITVKAYGNWQGKTHHGEKTFTMFYRGRNDVELVEHISHKELPNPSA